jgi:hypothetical protein
MPCASLGAPPLPGTTAVGPVRPHRHRCLQRMGPCVLCVPGWPLPRQASHPYAVAALLGLAALATLTFRGQARTSGTGTADPMDT